MSQRFGLLFLKIDECPYDFDHGTIEIHSGITEIHSGITLGDSLPMQSSDVAQVRLKTAVLLRLLSGISGVSYGQNAVDRATGDWLPTLMLRHRN